VEFVTSNTSVKYVNIAGVKDLTNSTSGCICIGIPIFSNLEEVDVIIIGG